jgi:hypothetical protein
MRDDGQNQLKISVPHPITETYRLIPLLASLILLDSPFNKNYCLKITCPAPFVPIYVTCTYMYKHSLNDIVNGSNFTTSIMFNTLHDVRSQLSMRPPGGKTTLLLHNMWVYERALVRMCETGSCPLCRTPLSRNHVFPAAPLLQQRCQL